MENGNEEQSPAIMFLQAYARIKELQPKFPSADCPPSERLEAMINEPGTDGPLRRQYRSHAVTCGYCANSVKIILRSPGAKGDLEYRMELE